MTKKNEITPKQRMTLIKKRLSLLVLPIQELWYGITHGTLPWGFCQGFGIISAISILLEYDRLLFEKLSVSFLYPKIDFLYWTYVFFMLTGGFWLWGIWQAALRQRLILQLSKAFLKSGLKNPLEEVPRFISDEVLELYCKRLTVTSAGIKLDDFKKAKKGLETAMQIYIDEIKEHRKRGQVEILYSYSPLSKNVPFKNINEIPKDAVFIGVTRAKKVFSKLSETPHYLIAGESGGGKSTFLRQLITGLYLRNEDYQFTLMDLKGGLEFQTFEGQERIEITENAPSSIHALHKLEGILEKRKRLFKLNRCKDLDAFKALPKEKIQYTSDFTEDETIDRHIIVIDEAFELFMAGGSSRASEAQKARQMANRLSSQGRALGIHLIVATQRPDRLAVDPLTKQNLDGRVCFRMANRASSMTILDNGVASEIPNIKGRGIWMEGGECVEIQAPNLSVKQAEALLPNANIPIAKQTDLITPSKVDSKRPETEEPDEINKSKDSSPSPEDK